MLLWLNLLVSTVVIWTVGAEALPYVHGMLIMVGPAGWIAILYGWSLGGDVLQESKWVSWQRVVSLTVVAGALAIGVVRASRVEESVGALGGADWSTLAGLVTGAGAVLLLVALGSRYARRCTRSREED